MALFEFYSIHKDYGDTPDEAKRNSYFKGKGRKAKKKCKALRMYHINVLGHGNVCGPANNPGSCTFVLKNGRHIPI